MENTVDLSNNDSEVRHNSKNQSHPGRQLSGGIDRKRARRIMKMLTHRKSKPKTGSRSSIRKKKSESISHAQVNGENNESNDQKKSEWKFKLSRPKIRSSPFSAKFSKSLKKTPKNNLGVDTSNVPGTILKALHNKANVAPPSPIDAKKGNGSSVANSSNPLKRTASKSTSKLSTKHSMPSKPSSSNGKPVTPALPSPKTSNTKINRSTSLTNAKKPLQRQASAPAIKLGSRMSSGIMLDRYLSDATVIADIISNPAEQAKRPSPSTQGNNNRTPEVMDPAQAETASAVPRSSSKDFSSTSSSSSSSDPSHHSKPGSPSPKLPTFLGTTDTDLLLLQERKTSGAAAFERDDTMETPHSPAYDPEFDRTITIDIRMSAVSRESAVQGEGAPGNKELVLQPRQKSGKLALEKSENVKTPDSPSYNPEFDRTITLDNQAFVVPREYVVPKEPPLGSTELMAAGLLLPARLSPTNPASPGGASLEGLLPEPREGMAGREKLPVEGAGLLTSMHPSVAGDESQPLVEKKKTKEEEEEEEREKGLARDLEEGGEGPPGADVAHDDVAKWLADWGRSLTIQSVKSVKGRIRKAKRQVDQWQPPVPLQRIKPEKYSNCCLLSVGLTLIFCLLIGGLAVGLVVARSGKEGKPKVVYRSKGRPPGSNVPAGSLCGAGDVCCSANQVDIYEGQSVMGSVWWSNGLRHNAQVQLYLESTGTWVGPTSGSAWTADVATAVGTGLAFPPVPTEVFTVIRSSGTFFSLLAPNGLFLAVQSDGSVSASSVDTDDNTQFRAVTLGSTQAFLIANNGNYLTSLPSSSSSSPPLSASSVDSSAAPLWSIREVTAVERLRGVNLGGWLVAEEWMTPSLFQNIPGLIDGTQVRLQSKVTGRWVGQDNTTALKPVVCSYDWTAPANLINFHIRRPQGYQINSFQIRTVEGSYWSTWDMQLNMNQSEASGAGNASDYRVHFSPSDNTTAVVQSVATGLFLQARSDGRITVDGQVSAASLADPTSLAWSGPTAFQMLVISELLGEWQLSTWLADSAPAVLTQHRDTFITETDFLWLQKNSLNAARISIGYWATQGDSPDAPYVPGSLRNIDDAFQFADKYNIRIFLSMHGALNSQNGYDHSASRDGVPGFSFTDSMSANVTLNAIEFLVKRYSNRTSFFGIGLLNEPTHYGVPDLNALQSYYLAGYDIVRKYSPCAYVAINPRIDRKSSELDNFMTSQTFTNVIIDLHEYHVFDLVTFGGKDVDFNIQYLLNQRQAEIQSATQGSRLAMVGEWSMALRPEANATTEDFNLFGGTQLGVYGQSSAGWFFWSLKLGREDYSNWSFMASFSLGWLRKVGFFW